MNNSITYDGVVAVSWCRRIARVCVSKKFTNNRHVIILWVSCRVWAKIKRIISMKLVQERLITGIKNFHDDTYSCENVGRMKGNQHVSVLRNFRWLNSNSAWHALPSTLSGSKNRRAKSQANPAAVTPTIFDS